MTTTTSTLSCPPRFGTPRSLDRETLGPAIGEVARRLGKPLMPWQQHIADVATEIDPLTGRFAYDEVGLTVPRQSGKSTLILAKATHRCSATRFFGPRQRVVYTAQTRNKAREKWEEDYAADLKASRTFGSKVDPHFGNGNEHLRFENGSRFGIEANTEKAGHGGTLDESYIDEAFAQADGRLEQAFRPAMITRRNTQLWWVSTAGWLNGSPYLEPKVTRGRQQAEMGIREGLAYFEWSAPDDAEVDDHREWWKCMPALGHTITERAIEAELRAMSDTLADFRRAYLNQWVPKGSLAVDPVISPGVWSGCEDGTSQTTGRVAFAVTVSRDRKWSTIAVCGRRPDGLLHGEVVQSGRGTAWVVKRVAELCTTWNALGVALNPSSPAGSLEAELRAARIPVTPLAPRQLAQACGGMYDDVTEGSFRHLGQPLLSIAVGSASRRPVGDAWVFRSHDSTDIAPLEAVTMARFVLVQSGPTNRATPRRIR